MKQSLIASAAFVAALNLAACNDSDDDEQQQTSKTGVTAIDYEPSDDDIANSTFSNTISIAYDGASATVSGSVEGVAITTDGADVIVTSSAKEVEYVLSGASSNGSLKIYSEYKHKVTLDGVALTSTTGAPLNNQGKKTMFLYANEGTTNSFVDAAEYTRVSSDEDLKACIFSEGQIVFCGSGNIKVTGNYKHAICSDDYVTIADNANITVSNSVKDGIHANDYVVVSGGSLDITAGSDGIDVDEGWFLMTGGNVSVGVSAEGAKAIKSYGDMEISDGTLSLQASGNAVYDSSERDYSSAACLKTSSNMLISGGTISATTTGAGGKAIKSNGTLTISGGSVTAVANGSSKTNSYSAKGIKSNGDMLISGGTIYAKSASHEGIESKATLTIENALVEVDASDDAINAASHLYVKSGQVYARATGNDGLDANGNLYIMGGTVVAFGSTSPECGLDANEEGGYKLYITGGTVIGIGGGTSYPNSTTDAQPAISFSASLANIAVSDASGNTIVAWDYANYATTGNKAGFGPGGNNGGNNMGGGSYTYLISTPQMSANSSYTVATGVTISGGTEFHGLTTDATVSGGSTSTTATASVTAGGSSGGGMPGRF